jgi:hypothetical protein
MTLGTLAAMVAISLLRVGRVLDWKPKVSLHPLVRLMVEHDWQAQRELVLA